MSMLGFEFSGLLEGQPVLLSTEEAIIEGPQWSLLQPLQLSLYSSSSNFLDLTESVQQAPGPSSFWVSSGRERAAGGEKRRV